MSDFNKPPSNKQAWVFEKLTGVKLHPDICARGGANIAIDALINAVKNTEDQSDIQSVTLPGTCFCQEYDLNGAPLLSTLVDKKFTDGITVAKLSKEAPSFKPIGLTGQRRIIIDASDLKGNDVLIVPRSIPESFFRPELNQNADDDGVRRSTPPSFEKPKLDK